MNMVDMVNDKENNNNEDNDNEDNDNKRRYNTQMNYHDHIQFIEL